MICVRLDLLKGENLKGLLKFDFGFLVAGLLIGIGFALENPLNEPVTSVASQTIAQQGKTTSEVRTINAVKQAPLAEMKSGKPTDSKAVVPNRIPFETLAREEAKRSHDLYQSLTNYFKSGDSEQGFTQLEDLLDRASRAPQMKLFGDFEYESEGKIFRIQIEFQPPSPPRPLPIEGGVATIPSRLISCTLRYRHDEIEESAEQRQTFMNIMCPNLSLRDRKIWYHHIERSDIEGMANGFAFEIPIQDEFGKFEVVLDDRGQALRTGLVRWSRSPKGQ